jgi:YVTN family beta-propeller protein
MQQSPGADVDRTAPTPRLWRHRRHALIAALVLPAVAAIGVTGCSKTPPTYRVTATVPVGNSASGVAVDPGTHTVYVTNRDDATVSVIDASTRTVTATVPVSKPFYGPEGVAVDPGTHTVYVTNYGVTVSVIDASTRTVTATVPLGTGPEENPAGVAVDPGTHTVYVGRLRTAAAHVGNYDGEVSVIDAPTRAVTATVTVGKQPHQVAVDPGTHTVYVTNVTDNTVTVIDASTRTVSATVPVGKHPGGVAVDPGTRTVYVANNADNTVSVIDASTRTVTATVPVGKHPGAVAVDPGSHTVYVTNGGDNTVSVIESR